MEPLNSQLQFDWPIAKPAAAKPDSDAAKMSEAAVLRPMQRAFVGCVLGAAIGDAMGHPTEFLPMSQIEARFGPNGVQGFELFWHRNEVRFAPYTDDTQMAEAVLRSLLESRAAQEDLDSAMQRMAQHFIAWAREPQGGHRAPGNACLSGCRALAAGAPWHLAGGETAGGCGSVMRAYPFGLLFHDDIARVESWAVAHSKLTHRDPIALAASAAMAVGVAHVLHDWSPARVVEAMIAAAARYSSPTAEMIKRAADEAYQGVSATITLDRLRGWAAHEAIAAAVYLYARHCDDVRAAILAGANSPGDSDSLATLAGALVGARCGIDAIPGDWVCEIERGAELRALALQV